MLLNRHIMAINRIKIVLVEKQRTSKWLAEQLGKSENTVSIWCSNKVQSTLDNLYEIAQILDVEVRLLITSSEETAI
nr:MAG TPA: SOS-response transcriptional repressor [Caudoviricetes sp.]